ncbi:tRNA (adenosine(37)-N6)-dimethylallyltransferase MiaA [Agromyces aerolatus]|uniref:tRNA (adenosine(37)-N6)-dimethylallyltransferase MiaA n=1 Tax=Agromyces sp. LY-1074 TaxID=3074080 RepID=UPI00285A5DE9|nr:MULTISPECIES: tRNA (adenosine(37)-N6)-dimethylallyltransferase MiaA [unclassified Agromyces]MDR5701018.1 tRNA (adenosine(37)-N6)-dimethylallyltransferase MiaA [Agromyces sp. LY-1074]MDR5707658.1 tRNA (adenosine(37)-N6)-dimethylallyltransferase MiaA [Agromyces sp. LY-1358]
MTLIAIVGATGTGKSAFALDLAEALATQGRRAEVVNADAMQLYRGMDIGTAKLGLDERRGVPHHLLDVLDVTEEASAAAYQATARAEIARIESSGAVALLVGGSGLYVSSVIHDFRFPGTEAGVRSRLEDELATLGTGALHARLRSIDPETAASVDPANGRRLVRALEVIELTGEPKAARLPDEPVPWRPHRVVHLRSERAELVERLDRRVEDMWSAGLVDEVERLVPAGLERGVTARKAIGYAQALAQLRGGMSRAEAIAETQQLTRTYARRQVSWFKRYPGQTVLDVADPSARAGEVRRLTALA